VSVKYETDYLLRWCFLAQSRVGQIKNIFRENNSSGITDSCLGCGRSQLQRRPKLKDLALIFRLVTLTQ